MIIWILKTEEKKLALLLEWAACIAASTPSEQNTLSSLVRSSHYIIEFRLCHCYCFIHWAHYWLCLHSLHFFLGLPRYLSETREGGSPELNAKKWVFFFRAAYFASRNNYTNEASKIMAEEKFVYLDGCEMNWNSAPVECYAYGSYIYFVIRPWG